MTADFAVPELDRLHGPARVSGGLDWGWRRDRSAMVCVARLPLPGERRFAVCCVRRWPRAHPLPHVVREIAESPAHFTAVQAETNGLGGPWADQLRSRMRRRPGWSGGAAPRTGLRVIEEDGGPADEWHQIERPARPRRRLGFTTAVNGVHVDARLKSAGYASLRELLERGALLLPASAAELRAELLGLRVTLTESGERIEGASDDLADALVLALRPLRFRDGGWGTALGLLADERHRLPGGSCRRAPTAAATRSRPARGCGCRASPPCSPWRGRK